jgi:hypothetical protein
MRRATQTAPQRVTQRGKSIDNTEGISTAFGRSLK